MNSNRRVSDDCGVAADASRHASVGQDVEAEIAAPIYRKHGSPQAPSIKLNEECGWKQGVTAADHDPEWEHVHRRRPMIETMRKDRRMG